LFSSSENAHSLLLNCSKPPTSIISFRRERSGSTKLYRFGSYIVYAPEIRTPDLPEAPSLSRNQDCFRVLLVAGAMLGTPRRVFLVPQRKSDLWSGQAFVATEFHRIAPDWFEEMEQDNSSKRFPGIREESEPRQSDTFSQRFRAPRGPNRLLEGIEVSYACEPKRLLIRMLR